MHNHRDTMVLLALIACGLWGLVLAQAGLPDAKAEAWPAGSSLAGTREASAGQAPHQMQQEGVSPGPRLSGGPTSTLPLRWVVTHASATPALVNSACFTQVRVTNLTGSAISVEVEWFDFLGDSQALRQLSLQAYYSLGWVTDGDVEWAPHFASNNADLGSLDGYAYVYATDPRIAVAAFQLCRAGDSTSGSLPILSINTIPAYPLGSSAEYFRAATPVTGSPPLVVPEVQE